MYLFPALSPAYTVCIKYTDNVLTKLLVGRADMGFVSHIRVCEHKSMVKLVDSPQTVLTGMKGLVL